MGEVKATEDGIRINGKDIHVFSEDDPADINWSAYGAEYVIESTGIFLTKMACSRHFLGGVKKVILTAPGKGDDIPSSTGAAKAVGRVIPELNGKMTGMSFRVPCNDVSVVDLTAQLKTKTNYKEICEAIKAAAEGPMKGIIEYNNDELVSADLRGNFNTCIFDEKAGIMLDDSFVKLIAWYDNEWGYSNKVIDLVQHVARTDAAVLASGHKIKKPLVATATAEKAAAKKAEIAV